MLSGGTRWHIGLLTFNQDVPETTGVILPSLTPEQLEYLIKHAENVRDNEADSTSYPPSTTMVAPVT